MSAKGRLPTTPSEPTTSLAPSSVLLVDDDLAVLKMTCKRLQRRGHRVIACSSGEEALAVLARETFDAMVSDVRMPGMTGMDLLRAVRERDLDLPVLLMTGDPELDSASAAVEYGAFQYLTKPVAAGQLEAAAERAVRLGKLARIKRAFIEEATSGVFRVADRAGADAIVDRTLECLYLAFQPIVDSQDRSIFGYETFMRSSDDVAPLPTTILRAAERSGRVAQIERKVRAETAIAMAAAPDDWLFFVNVHPRDLLDHELYAPETPLSRLAHRVVLEITDRAELETTPNARERVRDLRRMGYRFGLDDLGAGYGGLTTFVTLEPEFIKLDSALVRNIHGSPAQRQVVGSLSQLCRDMGARVIAEGVETPAEHETLVSLGCSLLQGHLYAPPGPAFPPLLISAPNR
ncbi:MAG TPA: EAL domain-containing protein [Polyangiaceae bacterium]|nr:EAL domain-containing protein [Polyangiaceae bacterium]